MAKSKEEIAKKVLQKLGALATGQVPSDADLQLAQDAYESVFQTLQAPELLAPWLEDDNIPENAVFPIVGLCAALLTNEFGVSGEDRQNILIYADSRTPNGAYSRLRANNYKEYDSDTDGPVEGEFY